MTRDAGIWRAIAQWRARDELRSCHNLIAFAQRWQKDESMSPAKSRSQANLFRAAEHGAQFPKARALRQSTTSEQRRHFTSTSTKNLPRHVKKKR